MTNRLLRSLIIAACIGGLPACSSTPVKVNDEVDRAEIDMTKGRRIRAQAAGFQLLLVIPINVNSRQVRAWEQLKQYAGNDYISDVTITERWTYGYVGTAYTTIIEANGLSKDSKNCNAAGNRAQIAAPRQSFLS